MVNHLTILKTHGDEVIFSSVRQGNRVQLSIGEIATAQIILQRKGTFKRLAMTIEGDVTITQNH